MNFPRCAPDWARHLFGDLCRDILRDCTLFLPEICCRQLGRRTILTTTVENSRSHHQDRQGDDDSLDTFSMYIQDSYGTKDVRGDALRPEPVSETPCSRGEEMKEDGTQERR
jgi:hypothetical protein